jgi:hypothetical protein
MAELILQPQLLAGEGWADYGLVDSGAGRKLERYGAHALHPPRAAGPVAAARAEWDAHGEFVPGADEDGGGRWTYTKPVPRDGWPLGWGDVKFTAQCTPFAIWASSRHGAGVGLDGQMLEGPGCLHAQPVRLHRRWHAGAQRIRPGDPCGRQQEIGGPGPRQCGAFGHGGAPGPLDHR